MIVLYGALLDRDIKPGIEHKGVVVMASIRQLQEERKRHIDRSANELDRLTRQLVEAVRRSTIRCRTCRKRSRLSDWTFIQRKWTDDPESFPKDYERESCELICPKCERNNYIFTHPDKDRLLANLRAIRLEDVFRNVIVKHEG